MRIGLASSDWAVGAPDPDGRPTWGGAGWYRLGLPGKALGGEGFDVVEGTLTWSKDLGRFGVRSWPAHGDEAVIHWDLDLVVLQRWMFASVAVESETARRRGQVIVQDVDDDFWSLDPRNRAYLTTDPHRHPLENRDHYLAALKTASAVTVSTPTLADALRRLGVRGPTIHVLPNHVEVEAFRGAREDRPVRPSPVLGWVGATAWRSGDLETLRGVLGPFIEEHDLRAFHGGHSEGPPESTFAHQAGVDPDRVRTAELAPIAIYPRLFRALDLGIVPLRNVAFNRSKSWIKGLEYAAAGVPFVASPLPEYVRLRALHGIGRVAPRPKDWIRDLRSLLDPEVRAQEAASNLEAVKALDISEGVHAWRDLYLTLLAEA